MTDEKSDNSQNSWFLFPQPVEALSEPHGIPIQVVATRGAAFFAGQVANAPVGLPPGTNVIAHNAEVTAKFLQQVEGTDDFPVRVAMVARDVGWVNIVAWVGDDNVSGPTLAGQIVSKAAERYDKAIKEYEQVNPVQVESDDIIEQNLHDENPTLIEKIEASLEAAEQNLKASGPLTFGILGSNLKMAFADEQDNLFKSTVAVNNDWNDIQNHVDNLEALEPVVNELQNQDLNEVASLVGSAKVLTEDVLFENEPLMDYKTLPNGQSLTDYISSEDANVLMQSSILPSQLDTPSFQEQDSFTSSYDEVGDNSNLSNDFESGENLEIDEVDCDIIDDVADDEGGLFDRIIGFFVSNDNDFDT